MLILSYFLSLIICFFLHNLLDNCVAVVSLVVYATGRCVTEQKGRSSIAVLSIAVKRR